MAFVTLDNSGLLPTIQVQVDATTNPTTATRTWTDITTLVRQLSFQRSGRNQEINRSSAGSLTAICSNANAAITGIGLQKRQWVQVQAKWAGVTYARWQGIIDVLPRKWPGYGVDDLVELHASDVFKVLGFYDLGLGATTFPQQRNDQRVSSILSLASVTAGAIDTNTDTADAVNTPFETGSMALDYLLQIEDSESGLLVANPDGTVSFQGRHWRYNNSQTPVATFGESAGQIPYLDDVEYDDDDSLIANVILVTPFSASVPVTAINSSSTAMFWETELERNLLSSDMTLATYAAEWLAHRYGNPAARIPQLTVELGAVARQSSTLVADLLAANNSSRFTWDRNASTPISQDVYVEQIAETIDVEGGSWKIKFQLSPASDTTAWILGTSLLGQKTILAY